MISDPAKDGVSVVAECGETREQLCFNPNVLTEFKLAGSPEVHVKAHWSHLIL